MQGLFASNRAGKPACSLPETRAISVQDRSRPKNALLFRIIQTLGLSGTRFVIPVCSVPSPGAGSEFANHELLEDAADFPFGGADCKVLKYKPCPAVRVRVIEIGE